jgi:protein-disulfide isomerase
MRLFERQRIERAVFLMSAALAMAGCSRPQGAGSQGPGSQGAVSAPAAASTASAAQVVAEVDGKPITRGELETKAAEALVALRQQEYETLQRTLDQMIAERLMDKEAAARKVSREALLKAEVEDRVPMPDAARIDAVYEQHKHRFPGQTKEIMTPDIVRAVRQQELGARHQAFAEELRKKASVRVSLEPPRAQVAVPKGSPVLGPETAAVTMVEFSDYQCSYCRRVQGVVDELVARYPGKLRLVHRDFPLDNHGRALPAARAAHCANEQGKFWDYHRGLFNTPGDFSDEDFKARAAALGLDRGKFDSCLQSPRHDAFIKASIEDGARIGVTGTPAFFINGRFLFGARPIEQFQEIIDAELRGGG